MKVKFLEECKVEAQGEIVQTFKAGEVYELGNASAQRWMRRNLATEVTGKTKKAAAKEAVAKKSPKSVGNTATVGKSDSSIGRQRAKPDAATTAGLSGKSESTADK